MRLGFALRSSQLIDDRAQGVVRFQILDGIAVAAALIARELAILPALHQPSFCAAPAGRLLATRQQHGLLQQ